LLISIQVKAAPSCDPIIKACEEVIAQADKTIESLKLERQIQKDLLDIKDERIKELDVWYRDPKYVLPLGILLGIMVRK
jgi:hypothetical protein